MIVQAVNERARPKPCPFAFVLMSTEYFAGFSVCILAAQERKGV